jgi:serine protease Do
VIAIVASALLVAAPKPAPAHPPSALQAIEREQQALFSRIAPAVVLISNGRAFGSGFFVSTDGLILTNAHVVEDHETVDVVLYDGRRVTGNVVERGADHTDVALVQVPLKRVATVELGGLADIQVGSWVGAVGHGEGAIFTATGRVAGIVTAKIQEASDLNFGISLDVARRSLTGLASQGNCLTVLAPQGVPVFLDGAMAGTGPRVVVEIRSGIDHEVMAVVDGHMKKQKLRFPETKQVELK